MDECAYEKGGCQDICVNTVGNYYCSCSDPEFSLAPDKRHCIDVSCRANENKTHYFLESQLGTLGCKTKLRRKGDFFCLEVHGF